MRTVLQNIPLEEKLQGDTIGSHKKTCFLTGTIGICSVGSGKLVHQCFVDFVEMGLDVGMGNISYCGHCRGRSRGFNSSIHVGYWTHLEGNSFRRLQKQDWCPQTDWAVLEWGEWAWVPSLRAVLPFSTALLLHSLQQNIINIPSQSTMRIYLWFSIQLVKNYVCLE